MIKNDDPESSIPPNSTQNILGGGALSSQKFKFVYGINSEVSMPTGSLCSERNAIGHALASNPCLKRSDMVAIAVLSVCLDKDNKNHLNPLSMRGMPRVVEKDS